jgi:DNA-binding transcriptional LysR family regulator
MNFHQLQCFYEVARSASFSRAAQKLFLTQPAVTWQVKNLESFYDLKFFERAGKKIALTDEGKILFEFADRIFNQAREAEEALDEFRGFSRGALRIDTGFTFGDYYLSALLTAFHRKYPKIVTQISTGNTSQIIENTLGHKNDIAFVAHDPQHEKIISQEVVRDSLVAVVSPTHPFARKKNISLNELEGQPLLLREKGSSPRQMLEDLLRERGISPRIALESASTAAIKKMAEAGWGIALLSQQVIRNEVRAKSLKKLPIRDAEIVYHFYLIYRKDKYFSRVLQAFRDLVLEFSKKGWTG